MAEEELAVIAAEQEGEAVQVGMEGIQAVSGVTDEGQGTTGRRAGTGASFSPVLGLSGLSGW